MNGEQLRQLSCEKLLDLLARQIEWARSLSDSLIPGAADELQERGDLSRPLAMIGDFAIYPRFMSPAMPCLPSS